MPRTLFDKIWDAHVVRQMDNGRDLLFIDRHILHEVTSPQAFEGLLQKERGVLFPALTISTEDHVVSTEPGRSGANFAEGEAMIERARANGARFGIAHFHASHEDQGIVHVMAPELGFVVPGVTAVCGDSHTCTLGALGLIAFGVGSSDVEHVLTTQCVVMQRPRSMRVWLGGSVAVGVTAKDVILHVLRAVTVAGGTGYAIEYAGPYVDYLGMEGRFTLCNMSIEMGAQIGLVAPDQKTFEYVANLRHSPKSFGRETLAAWHHLVSDEDAIFAHEVRLDLSTLSPQITWGTNPDQVVALDEPINADDSRISDLALDYMGLKRGDVMLGQRVDEVFIGSCTNGRLTDLRAAAEVIKGRRVDPRVRALVVPGSQQVKRLAEKEGLAEIFRAAGFEWREPGCSMCASINRDFVEPGHRSVSTTNRNFVGRQGPGARTHLASPIVAVASALAGHVADPRSL